MIEVVTLVQTSTKGGGMKAEQVDKVCVDWLKENYEVRRKLKLSDARTPTPEVFLKAFAKAYEGG